MLCDDHLCHSTSVLHISIQFVSAELNAFWIWAFNLNWFNESFEWLIHAGCDFGIFISYDG